LSFASFPAAKMLISEWAVTRPESATALMIG